MRHTLECCCGAEAVFDSSGGDGWTIQRMREDYGRWMTQHDGCPALYTKPKEPAPVAPILVPAEVASGCPHSAWVSDTFGTWCARCGEGQTVFGSEVSSQDTEPR